MGPCGIMVESGAVVEIDAVVVELCSSELAESVVLAEAGVAGAVGLGAGMSMPDLCSSTETGAGGPGCVVSGWGDDDGWGWRVIDISRDGWGESAGSVIVGTGFTETGAVTTMGVMA